MPRKPKSLEDLKDFNTWSKSVEIDSQLKEILGRLRAGRVPERELWLWLYAATNPTVDFKSYVDEKFPTPARLKKTIGLLKETQEELGKLAFPHSVVSVFGSCFFRSDFERKMNSLIETINDVVDGLGKYPAKEIHRAMSPRFSLKLLPLSHVPNRRILVATRGTGTGL